MNYDFRPSPDFVKGVKALAKRYPSLKSDLMQLRQSLEKDPEQGVDLGGGLRKIRMNIKSKGRGKAGGARVITCNIIISKSDMVIALVYIYIRLTPQVSKTRLCARLLKKWDLCNAP